MLSLITKNIIPLLELAGISSGKLLVAVSGGPDSMALLRGAEQLSRESGYSLIVGHFDHRWRPESGQDAEFVRETCRKLDITCETSESAREAPGELTLAAQRATSGARTEESARFERYAFLKKVAQTENCAAILTGHTADDQAETVLHHLLRGTGLAGLTGIPAMRALEQGLVLLRPLLSLTRSQLLEMLFKCGQVYRTDPSNSSTDYTRNRLRNELLPAIASLGFPDVTAKLSQLAEQAKQAHDAIAWMAEQLLDRALLEQNPTHCRVNVAALQEVPRHLLRELFVVLWKRTGWPRQKLGFREWDRLASLVMEEGAQSLPGKIQAECSGNVLLLRCV